jgi:predicted restriction endonuclease
LGGKSKAVIKVPTEFKEYLIFYASVLPDVFILECQLAEETKDIKQAIKGISEAEFESPAIEDILSKHDSTASITTAKTLQKIRKLDRSIGDSLKKLYDYRCQMTGEVIGANQGVHVVEAHHIDPFVTSLDNDAVNQMILSPSYHSIVHQAKPKFDRKALAFIYPNGLVEKVKVNLHL